jgi:hypothetical protein
MAAPLPRVWGGWIIIGLVFLVFALGLVIVIWNNITSQDAGLKVNLRRAIVEYEEEYEKYRIAAALRDEWVKVMGRESSEEMQALCKEVSDDKASDVPGAKVALDDETKRLNGEIAKTEARIKEAEAKTQAILTRNTGTLEAAVKKLADEAAARRKEAEGIDAQTAALIAKAQGEEFPLLRKTAAALRDTIKKVVDEWLAEKPPLEARKKELTGMVAELEKRLKVETEPIPPADGHIVKVNPTGKTATIDLGAADLVRPGDEFLVYSKAKAGFGAGLEKARVRVDEVNQHSSIVSVFDVEELAPVVDGDLIEPPVQDIAAKTFAIAGFFPRGGYTEVELKAILKKLGWSFRPELDASTNFIIIGETKVPEDAPPEAKARAARAEKLLEKARSFGTYPLTVRDFLVMAGELRRGSLSDPLPKSATAGKGATASR